MDRAHLDRLLEKKRIARREYTKLVALVERGVVCPVTDADCTPALAALWYRHAATAEGVGELSHVTDCKRHLLVQRSTIAPMRRTLCVLITQHLARNDAFNGYIGRWMALQGGIDPNLLTGVAGSWLAFAGIQPEGEPIDPPTRVVDVDDAARDPVQLIHLLSEFQTAAGRRLPPQFHPGRIVDELALANGWWAIDSETRLRALAVHTIWRLLEQSECAQESLLAEHLALDLGLPIPAMLALLVRMVDAQQLCRVAHPTAGACLTMPALLRTAQTVHAALERYHAAAPTPATRCDALPAALTDEQRAVAQRVVLDGARLTLCCAEGGTGKSYTAAAIAAFFPRTLCLGPTWRAVNNLRERLPTADARTLQGFCRLSDDQLDECAATYALVLVDEVSMVTLPQLRDLLLAFERSRSTARLLLLGDDGQIPCIGRGNALGDLLRLHAPLRLMRPMRTRRARILELSRHIRAGSQRIEPNATALPARVDDGDAASDQVVCIGMAAPRDASIVAPLRALLAAPICCEPWAEGYVQFITHTNDGVALINQAVHAALGRHGVRLSGCYPGDAVRCTHNESEYKNGTEGVFEAIEEASDDAPTGSRRRRTRAMVAVVRLEDGRRIRVREGHLQPAFASTVHKVQGGEYDRVALLVYDRDHYSREIAYTSVTRARRQLLLVGALSRLRTLWPERRLTVLPCLPLTPTDGHADDA